MQSMQPTACKSLQPEQIIVVSRRSRDKKRRNYARVVSGVRFGLGEDRGNESPKRGRRKDGADMRQKKSGRAGW